MRNCAVVSICARLVLLSIIYSRLIHVVPSDRNSFFTCDLYYNVRTCHIFFIHLSLIDPGCYLARMNSAKGTWESSYLFIILILNTLSIYPEVGLLAYMLVLFLVFQRNFIQFSMSISISIPTNSVQGFLLL
jgi:hypothetical protein